MAKKKTKTKKSESVAEDAAMAGGDVGEEDKEALDDERAEAQKGGKKNIDDFEQGYRPIAEKGQTLAEFEKEELSKHGMKFSDLVKTDYYWDEFRDDPRNAKVVSEAIASGKNPGDNEDEEAMKSQKNDTDPMSETKDNPEPPRTAATVAAPNVPIYEGAIPMRNGVVSVVSLKVSPERKHYMLNYNKRIGNWQDEQDYWKVKLQFMMDLYHYYAAYIQDVKKTANVYNNSRSKITAKESIGADVFGILPTLSEVDQNVLANRLAVLYSVKDKDDARIDHITTFTLPEEVEVQKYLSDRIFKRNAILS